MSEAHFQKRFWTVQLSERQLEPGEPFFIEWQDQEDVVVYETAFQANDRRYTVYKNSRERILVSRVLVLLDAQYFDDTMEQYTNTTVATLTGIPIDENIQSIATGNLSESQDAWIFSTDTDSYIVFNNQAIPASAFDGKVYNAPELQAVFLDNISGVGPGWGTPQDIYFRTDDQAAVYYCGYRKGYITLGKAYLDSDGQAQTIWVEWSKVSEIIQEFDGQVACVFDGPMDGQTVPDLLVFMIDSAIGPSDNSGVLDILRFELSEDSFKGWGPLADDNGNLDVAFLGEIKGGNYTGGRLQAGLFQSSRMAYMFQDGDDACYAINLLSQPAVSEIAFLPKSSTIFPNLNQTGRYQVAFSHPQKGLAVFSKQPFGTVRFDMFEDFTVDTVIYGTDADFVDAVRPDDFDYE